MIFNETEKIKSRKYSMELAEERIEYTHSFLDKKQ